MLNPRRILRGQRVSRRSFDRYVLGALRGIRSRRRTDREHAARLDDPAEVRRRFPSLFIKPRVLATIAAVQAVRKLA